MQIHVIRPRETLWTISRAYNISPDQLITSNEIPNPNHLVVGQTIVIPISGSYHWVAPGESLYTLSKSYNIPVQELMRINQITDPRQISVGFRIYIPPKPRRTVDVGAYIDPSTTESASPQVVDKVGDHLTYLNVFSYRVTKEGHLIPLNDQDIINAAYRHRVAPLMVMTNFSEGTFSTEIATMLFTNEAMQDQVLNEAMQIMEQKGYLGLDFDFEYLGAQNRERYNQFLRKARTKLKEKGYYISTALAPKSSEQPGVLYEGHDYAAHGRIVDFIFFMTYEWGWSGGPPMAVSPINQVRRVLDYAVSLVPRDKVMMGIPLYGYDWTLPYTPGGSWARSISPQEAILLAARYGAMINYDWVSQAPYFHYVDGQGKRHEVWFEDARSIQAKFNLVKELGIRGFFYWVLGNEFPQNWLLIEDNFVVRKRVAAQTV